MKVEVTYEALVQALIEAIRNERDQGKALMGLLSGLWTRRASRRGSRPARAEKKKKRAGARRAKPAGACEGVLAQGPAGGEGRGGA